MTEAAEACHYCRRPFTSTERPTRDHIVPVSIGASGAPHPNTVQACARCNASKGSSICLCGCPVCAQAIVAHEAFLVYVASYDPIAARRCRARYEAAPKVTVEDVIGAPRALILNLMDWREGEDDVRWGGVASKGRLTSI